MASSGDFRRLLDELAKTRLAPEQAELVAALREELTAEEPLSEPFSLLVHELKNFFALLESEEVAGLPSAATWAAIQRIGADYATLFRLMLAPGRHGWAAIAEERAITPLADFLEELIDANAAQASRMGMDLGYHLAPAVAPQYSLPREALRLVLQNLLHNAMAYADGKELCIELAAADHGLVVQLLDDATPLPSAEIERLLRPTEAQTHASVRGLGLLVIHQLLRSWRSELVIDATDEGNRFRFWLPAASVVEAATPVSGPSLGLLWVASPGSRVAWGRRVVLADCAEVVDYRSLAALERAWLLAEPPLPRLVLDSAAMGVHPEGVRHLLAATAAGQRPAILVLASPGTAEAYPSSVQVLEKPVSPRRLIQALGQVEEDIPFADVASAEASFADFPLQVLLVEDNDLAQELAQRQLQRFGANVTIAGSGVAALRALKRARFDWLFLDWQLPLMPAEEVLAGLLQLQTKPKVVLITAEPEAIPAAPARRAWAVLGKPLKRKVLEGLFERSATYATPPDDAGSAAEPALAYETKAPPLLANAKPDPAARRRFLAQAHPLWEELRRAAEAGQSEQTERFAKRLLRLAEGTGAQALARALRDVSSRNASLVTAEKATLAELVERSLESLRRMEDAES